METQVNDPGGLVTGQSQQRSIWGEDRGGLHRAMLHQHIFVTGAAKRRAQAPQRRIANIRLAYASVQNVQNGTPALFAPLHNTVIGIVEGALCRAAHMGTPSGVGQSDGGPSTTRCGHHATGSGDTSIRTWTRDV